MARELRNRYASMQDVARDLERVARGGSWFRYSPAWFRSPARNGNMGAAGRGHEDGFRVARTIEERP